MPNFEEDLIFYKEFEGAEAGFAVFENTIGKVVLYDIDLIIESLVQSYEFEDRDKDFDAYYHAVEYLEYNYLDSFIGPKTPAFLIESKIAADYDISNAVECFSFTLSPDEISLLDSMYWKLVYLPCRYHAFLLDKEDYGTFFSEIKNPSSESKFQVCYREG